MKALLIISAMFLGSLNAAPIVLISDFGLKDISVSAMRGIIFKISPNIPVSDITHQVTQFNIWEASYKLAETVKYWPAGTVFIAIVDPDVGTAKKPIVAKSKTGHYFVAPNNGTLTLVEDMFGLKSVREIDIKKLKIKEPKETFVFYGRDLFAQIGAMLASSRVKFEEIGPELKHFIEKIEYEQPVIEEKTLHGIIPAHDSQFGNVWTNIPVDMAKQFGIETGKTYKVEIYKDHDKVYSKYLPYHKGYNEVEKGKELIYANTVQNISFAINMGDFAKTNKILFGPEWRVIIKK